jgi:hypothetical protein
MEFCPVAVLQIRDDTQITHIAQNNTTIKGNTTHKTTHTINTLHNMNTSITTTVNFRKYCS